MRVLRTDRCVPKMRAGDVRRTPRSPAHPLAGYYVACPLCGKVAPILVEKLGGAQTFTEAAALTMTPAYECLGCRAQFSIVRDEFEVCRA